MAHVYNLNISKNKANIWTDKLNAFAVYFWVKTGVLFIMLRSGASQETGAEQSVSGFSFT